jgi:Lon protease-like protein
MRPSDLDALAIFPLPNAVLLPGGVLPLHVFEPRYREMTRECLAGSRVMAIALLRPGFEAQYHERPPVHAVCGIGTIVASDELSDGRYHLILRGDGRVRIEHELPARRSYREVRATLLPDVVTARPDELAAGHEQLLALCDRNAELRDLVHARDDAGACADLLCAALLQDPLRRQRVLEALDPADRIDVAVELVARMLAISDDDVDVN